MIPKRRFAILSITSAAALLAGGFGNEARHFRPGAADAYPHQKSEDVTVGAKPYTGDAQIGEAFGKKIDFAKYGVVPVLVVIENQRRMALDLRYLEVTLVASDGRHAKAVAPEELPFLASHPGKPSPPGMKSPIPLPKRKNPLNTTEISERAFAAKVIPPGDSASGFLYFEAQAEPGDKVYLNGLRDARSGQELLYFEFALQ